MCPALGPRPQLPLSSCPSASLHTRPICHLAKLHPLGHTRASRATLHLPSGWRPHQQAVLQHRPAGQGLSTAPGRSPPASPVSSPRDPSLLGVTSRGITAGLFPWSTGQPAPFCPALNTGDPLSPLSGSVAGITEHLSRTMHFTSNSVAFKTKIYKSML